MLDHFPVTTLFHSHGRYEFLVLKCHWRLRQKIYKIHLKVLLLTRLSEVSNATYIGKVSRSATKRIVLS